MVNIESFDENKVLERLKHYLPQQAPLKDFILQNPLNGFQDLHFEKAISRASKIFGYKTSLNIDEYRELYKNHLIREDILEQVIIQRKGKHSADEWIHNLFHGNFDNSIESRIGHFRDWWKKTYRIDLDHNVNNVLFKLLGGYLDQGIALWHFPMSEKGFLASVRELEKHSLADFVRTDLGLKLLLDENISITDLLDQLIGDPKLYENYLFEQQFSHPGWSGIVVAIEKKPSSLFDHRPITLEDLIKFELILEIDILEYRHKNQWEPFCYYKEHPIIPIFSKTNITLEDDVKAIWQEAYEWSYYDSVLAGIQKMKGKTHKRQKASFQALFCIDDREGSIRRHIETFDSKCETYGTPGHFGLEIFFQPKDGLFLTKTCPAPATPKYVIQEIGTTKKLGNEIHFSKYTNHPIFSFFFTFIIGFWSGTQMFLNVFRPKKNVLSSSSFSQMGHDSKLNYEYSEEVDDIKGVQVGLTLEQMTSVVLNVLKSIGLIDGFGSIVYAIGHGASSVNNPYYAEYDCGACSSRPGSVNARVFASMANREDVRKNLIKEGVIIPDKTKFIGGIHDTTTDEFLFFDEDSLDANFRAAHHSNKETFVKALEMNAKERARKFFSVDSRQSASKIHKIIKNRAVSLFEPRAELGHMNNSLCIVGRHSLHEGLFLDRRAFSNSYDYTLDPDGSLLLNILNAAIPVGGGINLQYLFSRTDVQKIGAGSKLPHNVMGLIGVTNGVEGDLRPGLALQMVETHDPIRLMAVVEHYPDVVLNVIKKNSSTYEWIKNEWVVFVVVHPETYMTYRFRNDSFELYQPIKKLLDTVEDVNLLVESHDKNFPVYLIKKS